MTKNIKAIAMILVIAVFTLALAGCGGGGPVGTWKATSAEAMGSTVDPSTLGDTSSTTFTLNADGTVTAGGATGGKWELKGDELTLSQDGISMTFEYTGSNLIMNMGIAKIIYSRV